MRLKFLLRPGWLALTLVVFVFATLCFTLLAPWQFSRDDQRDARNAALKASFDAPPRPLSQVLPPGTEPSQGTKWRRVTVTGTYLPKGEMIARLRSVEGEPAFEVVTPFRTANGTVVLIDRGYLRPTSQSQVPPYPAPPEGQVTLTGRIRANEATPKNRGTFVPPGSNGRPHTYAINSDVVASVTGLDVRAGYLQLVPKQPGGLGTLPVPRLTSGPFFSYALQWLAFGTMAILGWLYFTIRELKPGGALVTEKPGRQKRKSVSEILAEDEAAEAERDRQHKQGMLPANNPGST